MISKDKLISVFFNLSKRHSLHRMKSRRNDSLQITATVPSHPPPPTSLPYLSQPAPYKHSERAQNIPRIQIFSLGFRDQESTKHDCQLSIPELHCRRLAHSTFPVQFPPAPDILLSDIALGQVSRASDRYPASQPLCHQSGSQNPPSSLWSFLGQISAPETGPSKPQRSHKLPTRVLEPVIQPHSQARSHPAQLILVLSLCSV